MENYRKNLSQEELDQVMLQLQQDQSGDMSIDSQRVIVVGNDGKLRTLNEIKSGVTIDQHSMPITNQDTIISVLDCGHSVKDSTDIRMCDEGHTLCPKHELYYCSKCRKSLCYKEIEETDDHLAICKKCNSSAAKKVIIGILIGLGILFGI